SSSLVPTPYLHSFPTRRSSDLPVQQPVRAHARTLQVGAAVLAGLAGLALIGFVTSTVYCVPLGLTMSFEGESPLWWPVWGLRSLDRKSTRLNSSHEWISYAVFC